MDIMTVISTIGFPVAACIFMGTYLKEINKLHREDFNNLHAEHKSEMKEFSIAINNNTLVMQSLCDKLGKE